MSSSSSSTRQDVYQVDNRRVIGQGGASAEGGSTVTITTNTLDGDVVNRAFDFGGSSLDLVGGTVGEALGFGKDALKAVANANSDALAFADSNARRNSEMAYNFFGDALSSGDAALSKAFTFGSNAMDSNDAMLSRALSFGNNAMGAAFDTLGQTENLVKDAYADAKGRGALTDKMIMGAIAAMALVAFAAVKK